MVMLLKLSNFSRQVIKHDTRPNNVTFVAVLSVCAHVALVHEGHCIFASMRQESQDCGLVPRAEHHVCMVDILTSCSVSVVILDNIWGMDSLPTLNLSFNKLAGEVPNILIAWSLKFIFVSGNVNVPSGSIPEVQS